MTQRHLAWVALLVAALAVVSACAPRPTAEPPVSDALRADAEAYAESQGIPLDEAIRRMTLQDDVGDLQAQLATGEPDTFGGLWIEHEPAYRVVVGFTRDGARTLRRYVRGTPLEDVAEAREVAVTLAELESAQAATIALLTEIDSGASTGIDIIQNCVSLYAADPEALDAQLAAAGRELPDPVCIVPVGPYAEPPALTLVPGLAFPRQDPPEGPLAEMAALLIGELVVEDGCLRVRADAEDPGVLVIWPYDHTLTVDAAGNAEVRDATGAVVARQGDTVRMGGGESPSLGGSIAAGIPAACSGPYWIAARGIESTTMEEIAQDPEIAPVLDDLAARGIELGEPVESKAAFLYPEPGIMYALGERGWLHLHRFPDEAIAGVRAQSLPHELRNTMIDWVAPPHFYRCGRVIALYLGSDLTLLTALSSRCTLVAE